MAATLLTHLGKLYTQAYRDKPWHTKMNENLEALDRIINLQFSEFISDPTGHTSFDDVIFIVDPNDTAVGALATHEGDIAIYKNATWSFITPKAGWVAYCFLNNHLYIRQGNSWSPMIGYGLESSLPAASDDNIGCFYVARDTHKLFFNGIGSGWYYIGGGNSNPNRRELDSHHQLFWDFDEASGDFLEKIGSHASNDFAVISGPSMVRRSIPALFSDGARIVSNGEPLRGGLWNPSPTAVTLEGWFFPIKSTGGAQYIIIKLRITSGFVGSPVETAIGLYYTSQNLSGFIWNGSSSLGVTDTTESLIYNAWNHLGFTYDGSNMRLYLNGSLIGTTANVGSIDFGTPGRWYVGGYPTISGYGANGMINDFLVSDTVRNLQYFIDSWKSGRPADSSI